MFVQKQVEKQQSPHAAKLNKCVEARIEACLQNTRMLCCMLIDHRYAYVDTWSTLIDWKTVEIEIQNFDSNPPIQPTTTVSDCDDDVDLDTFLDCSLKNDTSGIDDLPSELIRYRAFLTTTRPTQKDPILFWKSQRANFKKLSEIAKVLLASPASASCSERTFSRCSDIIRQKKRNRTTIGTMNNILLVNELSKSERPVNDTEKEETESELSESDEEESDTNYMEIESEHDGDDGDISD